MKKAKKTIAKAHKATPGAKPKPGAAPAKSSSIKFPELTDELAARLQTDFGKLDCLSEVAGIGDYRLSTIEQC